MSEQLHETALDRGELLLGLLRFNLEEMKLAGSWDMPTLTRVSEIAASVAASHEGTASLRKLFGTYSALMPDIVRAAANQSGSERAGVDAYPRWRHKKRGTTYAEIGRGKIQSENWCNRTGPMDLPPVDMAEVVIYRSDDDGSLWVRPFIEFYDGRFEELATPPAQPAPAATHGKPDGAVRACTCHPSDNPPVPCAQKFAYSECVDAAAETSPGDVIAMKEAWRCYHCGFTAKTELEAINHFGKTMDFQSACQGEGGQWAQRLRRHVRSLLNGIETGAVKIETEQDETLERDLSFMRFAIDHYEAQKPTTKPEAPAVSVDAIKDIAAERKRQWHVEGWSPSHDDTHKHGELAKAAACYAVGYIIRGHTVSLTRTNSWSLWSWDLEWWKPKDRRRNLVRAGALIVAEIERLDRAALIAGGR